jgi:O-antigen/teichoic acid export membrane protein
MLRRALYNTTAQLLGKFVSAGAAFVTTLLLARALGSHYFGEYIKVVAFVALFYPLVDFGLSTIYLREARGRENQWFGSFLFLRILITTGVWLTCLFTSWALGFLLPGFISISPSPPLLYLHKLVF